jgi:divalent metal cation (Fe/Co/Zn/Cd) transporter
MDDIRKLSNWETVATWLVRITLLPLALLFAWSAIGGFLGSPPEQQVTNVLGTAVEGAVAALLFSAIFNSSPPWRNEALKSFLMWPFWIAVLFANLFFAAAAVSYLWGESFRLHKPTSTFQEAVAFASGLGVMVLEIMLVEKITKRRKQTGSLGFRHKSTP